MWRCQSQVIAGVLHYIDTPEGVMGLAKRTMFKMIYYGGLSNPWDSLMSIPEARQMAQCMTSHTSCVSYEILRREAQETMEPSDPAYSMYDRQQTGDSQTLGELEEKTDRKRERLIINPEFVESMDTGDGSTQYDEEYQDNLV